MFTLMFGLPDETLACIRACLASYPQINSVRIYGSRAKGNYRTNSDIDLAYSSQHNCSASLLGALDELPTPYQFDVTHIESLEHAALREHIERVGVLFYERLQEACDE